MDRTRERRWDQDSTALILLLNCHDTDGNQKFSILVFTHTFSLHNPSLGAEVLGSAQSLTHLSVSSGFPSGADAAFSTLVLTVLCQLKMNKCPVPVPWGQVCLGLWCSWSSGLGKGSGSAGALGSLGILPTFPAWLCCSGSSWHRDVQVEASHLFPNTAESVVLTCSVPVKVV